MWSCIFAQKFLHIITKNLVHCALKPKMSYICKTTIAPRERSYCKEIKLVDLLQR